MQKKSTVYVSRGWQEIEIAFGRFEMVCDYLLADPTEF